MSETKIITYETQDYSIFKELDGNREINTLNVKNIISNINKNGLKPTIIIVNENMEVIDGQHRLIALKELGLPVYYQVYEGLKLEDAITFNVCAKKWDLNDYIYSYAELGYKPYEELVYYIETYENLKPTNIITILNGTTVGDSVSGVVREGNLNIKLSKPDAIKKLSIMNEIALKLPKFRGRKDVLIAAISRILDLENVDSDRMIEQLENWGDLITTIVDTKDAVEKVNDCYNYRKKSKVFFCDRYYEKYSS